MNSPYERDYLDYTRISEEKQSTYPPKKNEENGRAGKIDERGARNLEFEKAAALRDELVKLKKRELEMGF